MRRSLVLLVLGALVVAGCGGSEQEAASPTTPEPPAHAADRRPAPPISGTTLEGERASLADFRGRPVLVNVWSSW